MPTQFFSPYPQSEVIRIGGQAVPVTFSVPSSRLFSINPFEENVGKGMDGHYNSVPEGRAVTQQLLQNGALLDLLGIKTIPDRVEVRDLQGGYCYLIQDVKIMDESKGDNHSVLAIPRQFENTQDIVLDAALLPLLADLAGSALTKQGSELFQALQPHGVVTARGVVAGWNEIPVLATPFQEDRFEGTLVPHSNGDYFLAPAAFYEPGDWYSQLQCQAAQLLESEKSQDLGIIESHGNRLLLSTLLLWLLLDKKLPSEYAISAGDWLVKTNPDLSDPGFMISTLRGGDLVECAIRELTIKLRTQDEVICLKDIHGNSTARPFAKFFSSLFFSMPRPFPPQQALSETRALIKPELQELIYPQADYCADQATLDRLYPQPPV